VNGIIDKIENGIMIKKLWFLAVVLMSMTSLTTRAAIETTRVIQEKTKQR